MKANATIRESPLAPPPLYKTIHLRMQLAVLAALDAKARRRGMTRTSCVLDAVSDWLEDEPSNTNSNR